jgi:GNAT superfamily N-acetyltransferase
VTTAKPEVRRVRAEDWQALRDTRLRALAEAPEAFGTTYPEALARPEQWWLDWAERSSTGREQAMFLAWEADAPVGIAGVCHEEGHYLVLSMWTDPRRRGRGIARALLDATVAFAGEADVRLGVVDGNLAALHIYERYGFVATGVTEPLRSNPALTIHELQLKRVR